MRQTGSLGSLMLPQSVQLVDTEWQIPPKLTLTRVEALGSRANFVLHLLLWSTFEAPKYSQGISNKLPM